ncbi:MAG: hypothetical protein US52_C0055G0002 [candidate division WS6 bacterium GW2011_GWA2_37_6]|uniref:Uncharacterized protein n=1 Tax=candidate division WS6 bacterium GW2011_GWA2_37_6 TaxID=1619087 RepID=A0A0G0H7K8_9BACT|nr:MAG: hypothetical protein US52_C0055G0002 [candidate division WS6 bacterium GW2011_GWA2_37_6]
MEKNKDFLLKTILSQKFEDWSEDFRNYRYQNIRELVERKIQKGCIIEAYILTDSYVDDLLEITFTELTKDSDEFLKKEILDKHHFQSILLIAKKWLNLDTEVSYDKKYTNFKKHRNTLVHNILSPTQGKKTKELPTNKAIEKELVNHINTFERMHLEILKNFYMRHFPSTLASAYQALNSSGNKNTPTDSEEILIILLSRAYPIAQHKLKSELIKKFGEGYNQNKIVTEYIGKQIFSYATGMRKL